MSGSDQVQISSNDVKDISEETGLKEEYIMDSVERQRADEMFKESKANMESNKSEPDNKRTFKNCFKFLARCFYIRPITPNFATITDISTSSDPNEISLDVETQHPTVADDPDNYRVKEGTNSRKISFNMNDEEDAEKIQNLLDYNDESKPSDLIECKIPITPGCDEMNFSKSRFYYEDDISHSNMTLSEKSKRFTERTLMKLNCMERASIYLGSDSQGEFTINKNFFLYLSILAVSIQFLIGLQPSFSLFMPYLLMVIINILIGAKDVFENNSEDRGYIKQKLKK